jgi:ankyrin repeat protein
MAQGTGTSFLNSSPARFSAALILIAGIFLAGCASNEPSNLVPQEATAASTPLMQAVSAGDLDQVEALAKSGASLNTLTEKGTPLEAAVRARQDRIAWFLLSEGAAPDLAGSDNVTPLMIAAADGQRRLVRLLLSAGADVNARDSEGVTPVLLAARNSHLTVVKVLLAAGANVNVSQNGRSLLMQIVGGGDLLTAEMLLAAGADVNYRNSEGVTALDVARAENHQDLEMLLVQAGADI